MIVSGNLRNRGGARRPSYLRRLKYLAKSIARPHQSARRGKSSTRELAKGSRNGGAPLDEDGDMPPSLRRNQACCA
jgi:hypothetical protein